MDTLESEDLIDWRGCDAVCFDPERLGGRATVGNSRMDADGIVLNYQDGMTVDELCEHFHVDKTAVRSIVAFYEAQQMKLSA